MSLFLGDFKKDDNPCREEVQDKLVQMNEQMSDVISMTRRRVMVRGRSFCMILDW